MSGTTTSFLESSRVPTAIESLKSLHRCGTDDVLEALNACNGDVCTTSYVLAHFGEFKRRKAEADTAAALTASAVIEREERPLRARNSNGDGGMVWISAKVDDLFGSRAFSKAAVDAIVTTATSDGGGGGGGCGGGSGGDDDDDDDDAFSRVLVVDVDDVVERLQFLQEKRQALR